MIQNDQQLAHTKAWLARFTEALEGAETASMRHPDPRMRTIMREALASQIEDLTIQVNAYETGASLDRDSLATSDLAALRDDDSPDGILERVALLELQMFKVQQEVEALRALVLIAEWAGESREPRLSPSSSR